MSNKQIKTGLLSGSFNPIHTGHLILGNYLCEFEDIDEIWFLVSPHNPLKDSDTLIGDKERINMVKLAISGNDKLHFCGIESTLPRPSYTIHTLEELQKLYPEREFYLIIGADNWKIFDQWKDYQNILEKYRIIIYPRIGFGIETPDLLPSSVKLCNAPIIEISSSFIREGIEQQKNMNYFLTSNVYDYIRQNRLYIGNTINK